MAADEGVAHLQAAAREMVAAAREFLDAVEHVVEDDDRLSRAAGGVTDLFHQASDAVSRLGREPSSRTAGREPTSRHIVVE